MSIARQVVNGLVVGALLISSQANAAILVANFGSDDISVIDKNTLTVTSTISVGDGPSRLLVVPPFNTRTLVTNYFDGTLMVIDNVNLTVTQTITVGTHPIEMALGPNDTHVYVVVQGDPAVANDSEIAVLDINPSSATQYQVTSRISVADSAGSIKLNQAKTLAFVTHEDLDIVSAIDTGTNTVIRDLPTDADLGDLSICAGCGASPIDLEIDETNGTLLVANHRRSLVSVVNISDFSLPVTEVPLPVEYPTGSNNPNGITKDFSGNYVVFHRGNGSQIVRFDASLNVAQSILLSSQ